MAKKKVSKFSRNTFPRHGFAIRVLMRLEVLHKTPEMSFMIPVTSIASASDNSPALFELLTLLNILQTSGRDFKNDKKFLAVVKYSFT